MEKKKFIITIDTEGDNLWAWKADQVITTENAFYLERFQNLSEKYGFKPTWLTNYEMANNEYFVRMGKSALCKGTAEIGMHLHAWNTPPIYSLPNHNEAAPYLIEYPDDVMEEKISVMTDAIIKNFEIRPTSHRAGRWAINEKYLFLLKKYGYRVDCSITPHIDWSSQVGLTEVSNGCNYLYASEEPSYINEILEVPVSIRRTRQSFSSNIKNRVRALARGNNIWLRPMGNNLKEMLWLLNVINNSNSDYIMFMLHSSEMMPGGNPRFKTENDIEELYSDIETVFRIASDCFEGSTLTEYGDSIANRCNRVTTL